MLRASSGRMVMQPTADLLVGGANPGRANMAAGPPITVDRQGFQPLTKKSAPRCVTIRPVFVVLVLCIPTAWGLLTTNF